MIGRSTLALVLLHALVGCSSPRPAGDAAAATSGATSGAAETEAGAPPGARVLTPFAFGDVRIGMTLAELNAALGDSLKPTYQISDACDIVRPASFPPGVSVMVEHDTVVRVDVEVAGVLTPEGAGVGDAESKLLGLYGPRAEVTPHKYTGPEGHYVTIAEPTDSTRLTIFETDGRTVVRYRAGKRPPVQYVEGCA